MSRADQLDRNWETSREYIVIAAQRAGVDVEVMTKIAGFESQFNSHARPVSRQHPELNTVRQFDGTLAISSAYGFGQFLNGTWTDMIHRYGEKYGVASAAHLTSEQANAGVLRNDVQLQASILAEFTRENVAKGARLGGSDSDANAYAFHNLGDGDATRFLTALHNNPNARVDSVLSANVISRNPSLYGDGRQSLADTYRIMGQHMDRYAEYAAQARAIADHQPVPPLPTREAPRQHRDHPTNPHAGGILRDSSHSESSERASTHARAPATRHANADGELTAGEHGRDITRLQRSLNRLGFTDAQGHALKEDGLFGRNTVDAVKAFQRAHALEADGVAGAKTQGALTRADAGLLTNPAHPHHAYFEQMLHKVHEAESRAGVRAGAHSEKLASALVVEGLREGLQRVDRVEFNDTGSLARAVQVATSRDEPALNRSTDAISTQQAMRQTVAESSQQAHQVAVNVRAQQEDRQRSHAVAPAM